MFAPGHAPAARRRHLYGASMVGRGGRAWFRRCRAWSPTAHGGDELGGVMLKEYTCHPPSPTHRVYVLYMIP